MIHFFVPGQPQGKGRARAFSKGNGKIGHYTPAKTRSYEGEIKARAMQAMGANKATDKPISLDLALNYEIPKTWPKWKRHLALTGDIVPTVKPDSDNVTKAIKDALNGIAWNDDCQVVYLVVSKSYSESPGVLVSVHRLLAKRKAQIKTASELA